MIELTINSNLGSKLSAQLTKWLKQAVESNTVNSNLPVRAIIGPYVFHTMQKTGGRVAFGAQQPS